MPYILAACPIIKIEDNFTKNISIIKMVLKQQMRCHKVSSTLISRKKIVKFVFLYGLLNKLFRRNFLCKFNFSVKSKIMCAKPLQKNLCNIPWDKNLCTNCNFFVKLTEFLRKSTNFVKMILNLQFSRQFDEFFLPIDGNLSNLSCKGFYPMG